MDFSPAELLRFYNSLFAVGNAQPRGARIELMQRFLELYAKGTVRLELESDILRLKHELTEAKYDISASSNATLSSSLARVLSKVGEMKVVQAAVATALGL